ncbi:MAG: class I SAM-dependent DNA methyltransferase, partial [Aeriscardovia sp.]|nr:class I SAM-dependent DNA methyltransferase [Aeriscardovia sp.]
MEDLFKQGQADKEAARSFVDKWKDKLSTIPDGSGEKQLDEKFWNDLIEAFGQSRDLLDFQHKTAGNGYADVVSKELGFIVEQKSKNVPLDKPEPRQGEEVTPFQQAFRYRAALTSDYSIRTAVTSNFEQFWFYNLMTNEGIEGEPCAKVALEEIPDNLGLFKDLFGGEEVKTRYSILNPEATKKAADLIHDLYQLLLDGVDATKLSAAKKEEYKKKIPLIIMRIVFLLFADNTSTDLGKIFAYDQFKTFLNKSTDPAHFTRDLLELFRCLNIETEEERADELIPEELMGFPYVDGGLFEESITFPNFSSEAFTELKNLAGKYKQWDEIDISVFGPIMDRVFAGEYRRENGIYYTSRENIQKVINPLFMDGLRTEFEEIKGIRGHKEREDKLKSFHDKLSRLQFFDPACGSGNFLTETYMELRDLEDEVIDLENNIHDLDKDVKVSLSQFHGIELEKYGAMVARTALQIAREQALERSYERFKDSVSNSPHFLPLKDEARGIVCGNALTMDWGNLVTPSPDLFIFGNPPFVGDHNKHTNHKEDLKRIFKDDYFGKLDYCTAWYYKTAHFLNKSGANFAFVSTNSITEGVQVEPLFKPIFALGWRIFFAYPSFEWPKGEATVAVVIIGLTQDRDAGITEAKENTDLIEIDGNWEGEKVKTITPYLVPNLPFDGFIHKKDGLPISELPRCLEGSKPWDGGGLILKSESDKTEADNDPIAAKYVKLYLGARELIHDKNRWCLWLVDSTPAERNDSKFLKKRLSIVRSARRGTKNVDKPVWLFASIQQPDCDYLAIPEVFDEDREYFTASYLSKEVIAS